MSGQCKHDYTRTTPGDELDGSWLSLPNTTVQSSSRLAFVTYCCPYISGLWGPRQGGVVVIDFIKSVQASTLQGISI